MKRIMHVYHLENNQIKFDFFESHEWATIAEAFFFRGGVTIPKEVDASKEISALTEKDYQKLFEAVGYQVIDFLDVDDNEDLSIYKGTSDMPHKGDSLC
jgi:hypothetical protein